VERSKAMVFGHERGNVIWLVLITVALLAALTMTLSRSGSRVENLGEREKSNIEALQLLRYARSLESAVQSLVFQDISENDLSFETPLSDIDYENANCSGNQCKIFHMGGAGLSYMEPKSIWLDSAYSAQDYYGDWLFTGGSCIPEVGRGDDANCYTSASNNELIMILPYIKLSLCKQLNSMLKNDFGDAGYTVLEEDAWDGADAPFTGGFAEGVALYDGGNLFGKMSGCFEGGGVPTNGTYHFYHVLKAR
jgi:hypothetical protein